MCKRKFRFGFSKCFLKWALIELVLCKGVSVEDAAEYCSKAKESYLCM